MAKDPAPAFQFYPSDWIHDLDEHPLEIEGAWIRICCKLFFSDTCGSAEKSLENWARILRISPKKTLTLIQYLDNQKIADILIQNEAIRITSRRMVKDSHIREIRRLAGIKGGNPFLLNKDKRKILDNQTIPGLDNQTVNQNLTPSSSSSSSVIHKDSLIEYNPISEKKVKKNKPFQYTDDFNSFWQAYPKQVGKGKAFEEWRKLSGNGIPPLEEILASLKLHTLSTQWTKDNGQFVPLPATWLHQRRWDDAPPLTDPFKGKVSDKTARTLENIKAWKEERHAERDKIQ